MRYVEYLNVRRYIEGSWPPYQIERLREQVVKQYRFRRVYRDAPSGLPVHVLSPTCILYDAKERGCLVYPSRPLACRMQGFRGECERMRIAGKPELLPGDYFSADELAGLRSRLSDANETFVDPATGRTVRPDQVKTVEFWFAVHEAGWDPTMDPEDESFLVSLMHKRAAEEQ
jgi:Fe-S-cluster containining protein